VEIGCPLQKHNNMINEIYQPLYHWFLANGLRILIILLGAAGLYALLKTTSKKIIKLILNQTSSIINTDKTIDKRRLETINNILEGTGVVIIISVAVIMILSELGFNIAPIIAGAGIIGLGIGIGSQSLVKDLVSGIFILIENQYDVGDKINLGSIAGTKVIGTVKMINLRRTMVEDENKNVHVVPNGNISLVTKVFEKPEDIEK
jgi:small conductance mechanosensitive channel